MYCLSAPRNSQEFLGAERQQSRIELLDDLVPSMWAEMLNDRSFEGVTQRANWAYGDGAPNVCDREWDKNETWTYDTARPFNGARSVRLIVTRRRPALLTQSGIAVQTAAHYAFAGWFRAENSSQVVRVRLKVQVPDGGWMTLASAKLPQLSEDWRKYPILRLYARHAKPVPWQVESETEGLDVFAAGSEDRKMGVIFAEILLTLKPAERKPQARVQSLSALGCPQLLKALARAAAQRIGRGVLMPRHR